MVKLVPVDNPSFKGLKRRLLLPLMMKLNVAVSNPEPLKASEGQNKTKSLLL